MKRSLAAAALVLLAAAPLHAQTIENYTFTLNSTIPDNDPTGLADLRSITSAIGSITDLKVTLNIAGGFNGDYYVYLTHGTGFAVLLNRVGSTTGNPFGYTDSGLSNVTFTGSALVDIHQYQGTQNPLGGALSGGNWQVDGRNVDPAGALDTDPRTAFLSSFNGLDANGGWTLFVADVAGVGQGTLVSWSLQITGVPEPGTWLAGTLAGTALALARWRRRSAR
ncbi:MAG: PEP-CTERM sorting domain-containing protein [Verrucomicrobia bacterium]|nr:PEP-CTERM sorting domain-containing protein [Verrucomicrobiota bacterium]